MFAGPSVSTPPMKLMDVVESDDIGALEVEFVNNEISCIPCKNFLNGYCEEGITCKYFHRYKLGVYAFCHKYQYSRCSVPQCKYVHASLYEQQMYYRTGKFTWKPQPHVPRSALNAVAESSLARLTRNPVPVTLQPDVPWLPISTPNRPVPMLDVADYPLPVTPPDMAPVVTTERSWSSWPWMSTMFRAPKRPRSNTDEGEASTSSGDSAKRCAGCDTHIE